jgi:hypothetical protein
MALSLAALYLLVPPIIGGGLLLALLGVLIVPDLQIRECTQLILLIAAGPLSAILTVRLIRRSSFSHNFPPSLECAAAVICFTLILNSNSFTTSAVNLISHLHSLHAAPPTAPTGGDLVSTGRDQVSNGGDLHSKSFKTADTIVSTMHFTVSLGSSIFSAAGITSFVLVGLLLVLEIPLAWVAGAGYPNVRLNLDGLKFACLLVLAGSVFPLITSLFGQELMRDNPSSHFSET